MCVRNHRGLDYSTNDCAYPWCRMCFCICRCLIMNHLKSPSLMTHGWWSLTNVFSQCLSLRKVTLGLHPCVWKTCFQKSHSLKQPKFGSPPGLQLCYPRDSLFFCFTNGAPAVHDNIWKHHLSSDTPTSKSTIPNLTCSLPRVASESFYFYFYFF